MRQAVTLSKVKRKLKGGDVEYWALRWFDTDGNRRSQNIGKVGELTKNQRRKKLVDKEREVKRYRGKCPTLSGHIDYYFKHLSHDHAASTLGINQRAARYMKAFFDENKPLDQFKPPDAKRFRTALIKGELAYINQRKGSISKASANVYLKFSRALFGVAVDEDIIQKNPFSKCLFKVDENREWNYLDQGTYVKLMENASPKIQVLLSLCRLAGLRCSEALNLRIKDANFDTGLIYVTSRTDWRTKSGKSRRVPMCPELASVLLAAAREAVKDGQDKFIADLRRDNTQRDISVVCKRAGVPMYLQPTHSLRKSCITDWAATKPIHVVQKWAGHADAKTTLKYYTQEREEDIEKVTQNSHWSEIVTQKVTQNPPAVSERKKA